MTLVPRPTRLAISTMPPCRRTIIWTIERPRPHPPLFGVRAGFGTGGTSFVEEAEWAVRQKIKLLAGV